MFLQHILFRVTLLYTDRTHTMNTYWETRKEYVYYKKVLELAKKYCPEGGSLLDVGGGQNCEYLSWFDWFSYKEIVDIEKMAPMPGITTKTVDFMEYESDKQFDLVLCLQVLEHLENPRDFCRKLFTHGKTVIISVPYKWSAGSCEFHLQDPVDEAKLSLWAGRAWEETNIATDVPNKRFIAVYK